MTYGDIGIKVWIYKGEIFAKEAKAATVAQAGFAPVSRGGRERVQ
jgi:ribosomal protein S3